MGDQHTELPRDESGCVTTSGLNDESCYQQVALTRATAMPPTLTRASTAGHRRFIYSERPRCDNWRRVTQRPRQTPPARERRTSYHTTTSDLLGSGQVRPQHTCLASATRKLIEPQRPGDYVVCTSCRVTSSLLYAAVNYRSAWELTRL